MILYLDSSSLVKEYLEEPHSGLIREQLRTAETVATSQVAFPEVLSAVVRRWRLGQLDDEELGFLLARFERDWAKFFLLPVTEQKAGYLVLRHPLRGFDAVHLAAALDLAGMSQDQEVVFSSFDTRLLSAARAEGLTTLPFVEEGLVREEWTEYGVAFSL